MGAPDKADRSELRDIFSGGKMILNLGLVMGCIEMDKDAIGKYLTKEDLIPQDVIDRIKETMHLLELSHNVCRYLSRLTDRSLSIGEYELFFDDAVESFLERTLGVKNIPDEKPVCE